MHDPSDYRRAIQRSRLKVERYTVRRRRWIAGAFLLYALSFAGLFALIAYLLFERVVHAIP